MNKLLLGAGLLTAVLVSGPASAGERVGDAALGAVSGAVVLGPVGAVAGAVVGYTAGPAIARSWGIGSGSSKSARKAKTPQKTAGN